MWERGKKRLKEGDGRKGRKRRCDSNEVASHVIRSTKCTARASGYDCSVLFHASTVGWTTG